MNHKFSVETIEAQEGELLSSQIFSTENSVRRYIIPILYRKRYAGQPTFDSRASVVQKSKSAHKKNDVSDVGEESKVRTSAMEEPIVEKGRASNPKAEPKLV